MRITVIRFILVILQSVIQGKGKIGVSSYCCFMLLESAADALMAVWVVRSETMVTRYITNQKECKYSFFHKCSPVIRKKAGIELPAFKP